MEFIMREYIEANLKVIKKYIIKRKIQLNQTKKILNLVMNMMPMIQFLSTCYPQNKLLQQKKQTM